MNALSSLIPLIRSYTHPHVMVIGCIAYANGLALLLTNATLGVRLKSYGLDYLSIGLFGLINLPYTCKFLWAPILDQVSLPFLKKHLGQRKSWLCFTQLLVLIGAVGLSLLHPQHNLNTFIFCGLLVSFSAASQHVLLLTYQMETLKYREWGIGEGMSVFAYRMGMLTSGAGALYLATYFSWETVYLSLSCLMLTGLLPLLLTQTPDSFAAVHNPSFSTWKHWAIYSFIGPIKDFIQQRGWMAILIFMLVYRLPENLLGLMQSLFLLDLGFSYQDIANVTKIFGLGTTILGGLVGGYWIRLYGFKPVLLWGTVAYAFSACLLLIQSHLGANLPALYLIIGLEHFLSGVTLTSFFAYQFTCCSVAFAATQLALLTALTALSRTLCAPLAGFIVEFFGWTPYVIFISLSSILGIICIYFIPFQGLRVERYVYENS